MGRKNSRRKKANLTSEFRDEEHDDCDTFTGTQGSGTSRSASSYSQGGVKIKYVNGEPTMKLGIKHVRGMMGFRELQRVDPEQAQNVPVKQEDYSNDKNHKNTKASKKKKKAEEEEAVRGLGVVDLVNGKKELISHWGSLSRERKQAVLFVPKEKVLGLFRYLQRAFDVRSEVPKGSVIEKLQASFILHMEEAYQNQKLWRKQRNLNPDSFHEDESSSFEFDHVLFSMKEPSPPELAVLMVLKGNLELSYAKANMHWNFSMLLMFYAWYFSESYILAFLLIATIFFFIYTQISAVAAVREYLCYMIDASFAAKGDPKYVNWKANWFLTSILLLTFSCVLIPEYIWIFLVISLIPYALIVFEEEDPYQIDDILGESGVRKWKHRLTFFNTILLACFTYYEWEPLILVAAIFFSEASTLVFQLGFSLCLLTVLGIRDIVPRIVGKNISHTWQMVMLRNRNVFIVSVIVFLLNVAVFFWHMAMGVPLFGEHSEGLCWDSELALVTRKNESDGLKLYHGSTIVRRGTLQWSRKPSFRRS
mmetsp:Transcript_30717/g.37944  ORF Transcript_30717/g.37944 Transcript_30717/m.37944 type:complete len:535 (-) Transcript_30717:458-2062(-)